MLDEMIFDVLVGNLMKWMPWGACRSTLVELSGENPQNHYFTLGLPPTQDSSHHDDYYIFSRESQPKPPFATGILGGG